MTEFAVNEVQATMYSDAILVTSMFLGEVLSAVQSLWFLALRNDLMIRGAIAKGRYWEERQGNHLLVASDALVRAVKLERSVSVPAVVVADDMEIPDELWMRRFVLGPFETPLLHFGCWHNIAQPQVNAAKSHTDSAGKVLNEIEKSLSD